MVIIFKSFELYFVGVLILVANIGVIAFIMLKKHQNREITNRIKEERKRILQDAHDKIYSRLGVIAKKAEFLSSNSSVQASFFKEVDSSIRQTIDDFQEIVAGSKKAPFELQDLVLSELRNICREHVLNFSQELKLTFYATALTRLNSKKGWHVQCILQECLNNAGKHSMAETIDVFLEEKANTLIMTVADNGQGFQNSNTNSFYSSFQGIKGMHYRASKLGGELKIDSNSKGTSVVTVIPLSERN